MSLGLSKPSITKKSKTMMQLTFLLL
uniref:Uncharacterized protein n=1 Tax=Rhizophora mucronata TaxID=61149 RepID=A0A2P2Q356_RHIMU